MNGYKTKLASTGPAEEVNERLTRNMQNSFEAVWQMQQKYNVAPRLAAYMVALERLVIETTLRGYNC